MSEFDAVFSLPLMEADELSSFYENTNLIGCSAALGRKYQISASSQATIGSVYPELLGSSWVLTISWSWNRCLSPVFREASSSPLLGSCLSAALNLASSGSSRWGKSQFPRPP